MNCDETLFSKAYNVEEGSDNIPSKSTVEISSSEKSSKNIFAGLSMRASSEGH